MKRSAIGLIVALVLLVAPLCSEAQLPAKVPRIGYLAPGLDDPSQPTPLFGAFRQGLRDLGYVEGQNIAIESRFAGRREDPLAELAAELVHLNVDIIVVDSTVAIRAVRQVTETIPIVMATSGDPIGTGVVAGLARPGGNTTGLTSFSPQLSGKRLELLKEAFPGISRVAVLWNPTGPAPALAFKETEVAARALGLQLQSLEVRSLDDFEGAFEAAISGYAEALIIIGAPITVRHQTRIVDFAARRQLPAMYPFRWFAEAGGLMAYGPNLLELSRRAAYYVDRILKGAKPADLPVEQPMRFELVINLKTAKALGLTIPPTLLFQATEVIQ